MTFEELKAEFELFDDFEEKYRALIDLGRHLEAMPPALKTDATKVRGCSSQVWLHSVRLPDGRLHFQGDSDAHIVKGLVALLFLLVQDRTPAEIAQVDARARLAELGLGGHLSPTRTNGFYSMVGRIQGLAAEAVA